MCPDHNDVAYAQHFDEFICICLSRSIFILWTPIFILWTPLKCEVDITIELNLSGFTYGLQGCVHLNFGHIYHIAICQILINFLTQIQNKYQIMIHCLTPIQQHQILILFLTLVLILFQSMHCDNCSHPIFCCTFLLNTEKQNWQIVFW